MTNQLEELQKLDSMYKTYKIPANPQEGEKQADIRIYPLALDETYLMSIDASLSEEEVLERVYGLLSTSMRVDKEAIYKLQMHIVKEIQEAIRDANGMGSMEEQNSQIKDFIKQKQDLVKAQNDAKSTTTTEPENPQ